MKLKFGFSLITEFERSFSVLPILHGPVSERLRTNSVI